LESINHFDKTPHVKQLSIINAGFFCFGKDGYKKTSMSEIAEKAGVSKAALFHYFGTKKDFFLYLFKFSSEEIAKQMRKGTDDFFESIWIGSEIKMKVMAAYPGMYDFLLSLVKEEDAALTEELRACNKGEILEATTALLANVNWEKLKPDVDRQTAIELVTYVSDGYIRNHAGTLSRESLIKELKRLLELIRKAIYREEYQ
jgi:AcrR family transcriptional regulator